MNLKHEIQIVFHREDYFVRDTCKVCCTSASPIVCKNMETMKRNSSPFLKNWWNSCDCYYIWKNCLQWKIKNMLEWMKNAADGNINNRWWNIVKSWIFIRLWGPLIIQGLKTVLSFKLTFFTGNGWLDKTLKVRKKYSEATYHNLLKE